MCGGQTDLDDVDCYRGNGGFGHLIAKTQRRATIRDRMTPGRHSFLLLFYYRRALMLAHVLVKLQMRLHHLIKYRFHHWPLQYQTSPWSSIDEECQPKSKNHQEAARSARSLSPRLWSPSALLNASTAFSNVDNDTAPKDNDDDNDQSSKLCWLLLV